MNKVPTSKFLKIACPRCRTKRVVFGNAATLIKCHKCNYLLLKTSGGKARLRAPVKEVLWN